MQTLYDLLTREMDTGSRDGSNCETLAVQEVGFVVVVMVIVIVIVVLVYFEYK